VKVLVMPIGLSIGGSEINAVELAASVRARGHDVAVVGQQGPLAPVARSLGLRVIEIEHPWRAPPRPATARVLRRVIKDEQPHVVHVYEPFCGVEAFYAVGLSQNVPVVTTLYGMSVDAYMPRVTTVIGGTEAMCEELRATRSTDSVFLIEPPVDTTINRPDDGSGRRQRRAWGVSDDTDLVVMVSRLDLWMKLDALMDGVDAVSRLAQQRNVRLAVVGDGPVRPALERRAAEVNRRHGRRVVDVVGAMVDPVPAYRAADVVAGMGTSLLRGMAAGKPAVVVGELGFVRRVDPTSIDLFRYQGFWGRGSGARAHERLAAELGSLLDMSESDRSQLVQWGRELVSTHHGLESCTNRLLDVYQSASTRPVDRPRTLREYGRVPAAVVARKLRDRLPGRRAGLASLDADTNLPNEYWSIAARENPHRSRWQPLRRGHQAASEPATTAVTTTP
jgi:glycosyltransferase involved in cell wall biosynthesis